MCAHVHACNLRTLTCLHFWTSWAPLVSSIRIIGCKTFSLNLVATVGTFSKRTMGGRWIRTYCMQRRLQTQLVGCVAHAHPKSSTHVPVHGGDESSVRQTTLAHSFMPAFVHSLTHSLMDLLTHTRLRPKGLARKQLHMCSTHVCVSACVHIHMHIHMQACPQTGKLQGGRTSGRTARQRDTFINRTSDGQSDRKTKSRETDKPKQRPTARRTDRSTGKPRHRDPTTP